MNAKLIAELLNAYQFCLTDGLENAVRVFTKHREWLEAQAGKEYRQVERELRGTPHALSKEKVR